MASESYPALWRASAFEAVKTEDLPECLAVITELFDGAIGQGNASRLLVDIELLENETGILKVSDNGVGIKNIQRLLTWSEKNSTDVHHRYGFGSKKCLTKWGRDYNSKWLIRYRNCDKKGMSGSLWIYESPFMGTAKHFQEDEKDETTLMPSGTEWQIEFKREILGNFNNVDKLFQILSEIIRTRYSRKYLDKTDFQIRVKSKDQVKFESSKEKKWKTFEEVLQNEVVKDVAEIQYQIEMEFNPNVRMRYIQYFIKTDGRNTYDLKTEFPTYGNKNQKCARMYVAIAGRTIEISPIWNFYLKSDGTTKDTHNIFNGKIGIVDFYSITNDNDQYESMPTPCTTKVSFDAECKNYRKFVKIIQETHRESTTKVSPKKSSLKKVDENKNSPKDSLVQIESPIPTVKDSNNTQPGNNLNSFSSLGSLLSSFISPSTNVSSSPVLSSVLSPIDKEKSIVMEKDVSSKKPTIVKSSTKKSLPIKDKSQQKIWEKYIGKDITQHKCFCCKKKTITFDNFISRKVKFQSNSSLDNVRPICSECNQDMDESDLDTYVIHKNYLF
jgi:hypothetical protein